MMTNKPEFLRWRGATLLTLSSAKGQLLCVQDELDSDAVRTALAALESTTHLVEALAHDDEPACDHEFDYITNRCVKCDVREPL
jgi:hypothetical protein